MKYRLWRHNFWAWRHEQNFIAWLKLYCRCGHVAKVWLGSSNISVRKNYARKNIFFEGCSWFKFNNVGLALGMALKFYNSVAKGQKKVRKFLGLIPTFVEITMKELVGGFFPHLHLWTGLKVTSSMLPKLLTNEKKYILPDFEW